MTTTYTFAVDTTEDADIIAWLETQPTRHRSAAIRRAIRQHIDQQQITLADIYTAIIDLRRLSFTPPPTPTPPGEDDDEPPEAAANLAALLGGG